MRGDSHATYIAFANALADRQGCGRWPLPCRLRRAQQGPILEVLARTLPASGLVLEIGSGTGQHVAHFARTFPQLLWQPSDVDMEMRRSVSAWIREERLTNVREPI